MNEKLSISYHTAKKILLELLENNDFSNDQDIMKLLVSVVHKDHRDTYLLPGKMSKIVIDRDIRIFLPDYSKQEVKMPYLPKTVFLFFLLHREGIKFKSMYNYKQELYDIYQIVASEKNTEARKMRLSLDNLVEPVNNRIYETCSIIRKALQEYVPHFFIEQYRITGVRGEPRLIKIDRTLVEIENEKLKEIFNNYERTKDFL